jgi:16S rRNA (cytidine1402-2'-O)-methyltransferase
MIGKLYLCATPIGNLEDITFRVIRMLKEADLIAAEDTRHSIKLLNYFEIKTPMTSYHEFNKIEKAKYLVNEMLDGKNIALITDAGTPGISDPGEELVKQCYEAGITVSSIPGPAACISALIMSGQDTRRFSFEAFLPTDKKERNRVYEELKIESRTIIIYESPHHLIKTLKELRENLGNREMTLLKELTKIHERAEKAFMDDLIDKYEGKDLKGEYVLVIPGKSFKEKRDEEIKSFEQLTITEHMNLYLLKGMEKKEAMKAVAKDRGVSKRDIYNELCE